MDTRHYYWFLFASSIVYATKGYFVRCRIMPNQTKLAGYAAVHGRNPVKTQCFVYFVRHRIISPNQAKFPGNAGNAADRSRNPVQVMSQASLGGGAVRAFYTTSGSGPLARVGTAYLPHCLAYLGGATFAGLFQL